jgi:hypothetical protein
MLEKIILIRVNFGVPSTVLHRRSLTYVIPIAYVLGGLSELYSLIFFILVLVVLYCFL